MTLEKHVDKIKEKFQKLIILSDETIKLCWDTSYYSSQDKLNKANEALLIFEYCMEAVWSRCAHAHITARLVSCIKWFINS